ncbi:MAG: histidinol-phosphate transaminase [Bacilli bacterium]|nr:histidinol-phosphate transaminase [Bacilli bacterium]
MEKIANRVRPNLFGMVPYSPGKPIGEVRREYQLDEIIKIASNENPLGASELVRQRIIEALSELHRYPDGAQYDLKQTLSKHLNVAPDTLLIGNGSDEIIKLLCETLVQPGDGVIYPMMSFAEYEFGARLMDAELTAIPLNADFTYDFDRYLSAVTKKTKLIFVCSPNNPTGTYIPFEQLRSFVKELPKEVVVAVDEAYLEYVTAPDYRSAIELIGEGYNIVCMRTFSKAYALAALRVGYCVAQADLIDYVNRTREPFNVNHLAQVAAVAALEDQAHVRKSVELNTEQRQILTAELERLGMKVTPSQSNFILFDTARNAKELYLSLLKKGVIVRTGFAGLDTYIRVSIGLPHENQAFLAGLKELL